MKRSLLLIPTLILSFLYLGVQAQTTADGQIENMRGFAQAVSVANGAVFIGEPSNDHQPGAVYIFQRSDKEWAQKFKLMADNGSIGDDFGSSVSADGNRVLVGAPGFSEGMGAVYIFEKSNTKWNQVAQLSLPDDTLSRSLGSSVILKGDQAFVGSNRYADGKGAVFVYKRSKNGTWTKTAEIMHPDSEGSGFGSNLAMDGMKLVIGAPQRSGGSVYVFQNDGMNKWTHKATLTSEQATERSRFGSAVAIKGDQILVGAPRDAGAAGSVFVYRNQDDNWNETGRLVAFDGRSPFLFGSAITFVESSVWIGAPNANDGKGTIYRFEAGADHSWSGSSKMTIEDQEDGDNFAGTLAVEGKVAVVGLVGADYGSGSAAIMEATAQGTWMTQTVLIGNSDDVLQPITNGRVDCSDGKADLFGCNNVDLISFMPIRSIGGDRGVWLNDLWGWTDPLTQKEYALVGRNQGTSFVDVTDPGNPIYVANLPMTEGARANVWRDIKVYKDHAYIVADGAGEHGMQVVDLTELRKFTGEPIQLEEVAHYDKIHSAHNVVINEDTGFAYIVGSSGGGQTCGGGLHMVNIQDPANPTFAGCFSDPSTGRSGTGYSHDAQCVVYHGPDKEHQGSEICFGANETAISIADVTDKENPVALSTGSYPDYGYVHQGWLTEDHKYFFQNDELDELMGKVEQTRTIVWDVTDLDDPQIVKQYYNDNPSSDHNLYIKDGMMYQSNYVSGLQVIDVSNPIDPKNVGSFDTFPFTKDAAGFSGTWSNYPYFKSGVVVMTSGREGMFILETNQQAINQ